MMKKYLIISLLCTTIFVVNAQDNVAQTVNNNAVTSFQDSTTIEEFNEVIRNNAFKAFQIILKQKISINSHDSLGATPLIEAVKAKNMEIVTLLIDAGADVNLPMKSGLEGTPLMYACSNNDLEMVKTLVENDVNINQLDVNGDHALNWATYYGYTDLMNYLLANGADINLKSKHGTAIDVGFRLWHADSVAQVFVDYIVAENESAKLVEMINAVKANDMKQVAKLIKKGVSPNQKDVLGTPLLHMAAEHGFTEVVKLLLENDANANEFNRVGQTALAIASRFGKNEVIDLLLNAGADPNMSGVQYRLTSLIGASVLGDVKIGEKLLVAGAVIDATDSVNQAGALHWSISYGNKAFVSMLLKRGADYNKPVLNNAYTGKTLAEAYGLEDIVKQMQDLETKKNPMLGSWSIKEIHYIYPDTTYKVNMEYQGRLIVSPKRYSIMYNPYGAKRNSAKELSKLEDKEMIYAFKTIVFNSGTYQISDSVFTTTADIAKVAGFEGGIQYYEYNFSNNQLNFTMFDETYPDGGKPEWYGKLKVQFIMEKEE